MQNFNILILPMYIEPYPAIQRQVFLQQGPIDVTLTQENLSSGLANKKGADQHLYYSHF